MPSRLVVYGFVINLFIGVVYAWSVISHQLTSQLGWTIAEANAPFAAHASLTSVLFIVSGGLRDRYGARLTLCSGVALFALGLFLSSFTSTSSELMISFSLISGVGSSLCLSSIIPTVLLSTKPIKRSKASGVIVSGFALSPLLFAPLLNLLFANFGFYHSLELLGVITFVVTFPIAWKLTANARRAHTAVIKATESDSPLLKTLQTRSYYAIWVAKVAIMATAFMFIGNVINIAHSFTPISNLFYLTSLFAVSNFFGRISSGFAVEKIGESATILTLLLIQAINLLLFLSHQSLVMFTVGVVIAGYSFGGAFGLLPALVANKFGLKYYGLNWGATSFAAAMGSYFAHLTVDMSHQIYGDYTLAFLALASLNLVALVFFKFNFKTASTSD